MNAIFRQLTRWALPGSLVAVALTGCQATQGPVASPSSESQSVQPKVNRLVMAVEPVSRETNELRHLSSPDIWPLRSVYEYPIMVDVKTGKFAPGLALEWKQEPDGLSYRVKLRKGVQFHFGYGEFTGKDMVYHWKEITLPDSLHGEANWFRRTIKDVDIVNDYEVIYHLTKPDGQFLWALSEHQGGAEIRSKAQVDKTGIPTTIEAGAQAGTGPYQYKAREQAKYVLLERAPFQHWSGVTPEFPEFEFRFIREASTRAAALLAGEVHLAALPSDLTLQAEARGMKALRAVFDGQRVFMDLQCCYLQDPMKPEQGWRYPESPLMDVRVRKALNKAINRGELNKAFFGGKGTPMYLNNFHPIREGWSSEWERRYPEEYGYDPGKARGLLAEAGFGPNNPMKTSVIIQQVPGVSGGPDIAEAIAGYWRAVGINVELLNIDPAEQARLSREFKFSNHLRLRATGAQQWTSVSLFNSGLYSLGGGAEDPALNAVLQELTNTLDPAKRDELWRKGGNVLYDKFLALSLLWLPVEATVNPAIVSSWVFPGSITGSWTHLFNIRAAR